MAELDQVERIVRDVAGRRGLEVQRRGSTVVALHPSAPLFIEVRETSKGFMVRLGYEQLRDFIRDVLDSEEDPRGYIEELLDELSSAALEVYEELRRAGIKAIIDTRSAAMDVLSELEEAEEE